MRTLDRGICGSGKTAGRRAGGHAGNQYFLPERKEGGIAFGQDPKAVEAITKEMKSMQTAGDHETESECHRHHRDGACSGSRWCGCPVFD